MTEPLYLDVTLKPGAVFNESLPREHNAFIQIIAGTIKLGSNGQEAVNLQRDQLAVLGKGDSVEVTGTNSASRFLLIAGKPLNESIARAGPFVMNTEAELRQAFRDYQSGQF